MRSSVVLTRSARGSLGLAVAGVLFVWGRFVCFFVSLYVGWPVDFAERRQYSDKDMLPFIYKGIRSLIR